MIRITKLMQTCSACPSQWEGQTAEGQYVYIRYRYGHLLIEINELPFWDRQLRVDTDVEEKFRSYIQSWDGNLSFEALQDVVLQYLSGRLVLPDGLSEWGSDDDWLPYQLKR